MVTENNKPTSQHSTKLSQYAASNWSVTFGLAAAVLLAGILYFSFSGDLIDERSTAVPPPAATAPLDSGPATPAVPSTK